ncbi:MAG: hypothetical protein IJD60_01715 [Clostridia bacterium]|nr:hypothetical protein [Clostridia bacterium]
MKRWICLLLGMMMLAASTASAQEYVSVSEIYDQAQAMGGVWQETFSTPNGEMKVDAPIIVPDVDAMPVLTLEGAKISEELFEQIASGKKYGSKDDLSYETELNGELLGFNLGRENDDAFGEESGKTGYDAVKGVFVHHGKFLNSRDNSKWKGTMPREGYYLWELDLDAVNVRKNDITVNKAMRLWHEDLALCYPDDVFSIRPTKIVLRGSTLNLNAKSKDKRDGLIVIEGAEQLIGGIPLLGSISMSCGIAGRTAKDVRERREDDDKYFAMHPYRKGCYSVIGGGDGFYGTFMNEETYRTSSQLARVRTTEYADIPLASLDDVLDSVREKIESGNIIGVDYIKLGYLLYSNPDMKDYAWAIPRWIVEARYMTEENKDEYMIKMMIEPDDELVKWENHYQAKVPVDAQTGEMIVFVHGTDEIFSVPEIATWDDVK